MMQDKREREVDSIYTLLIDTQIILVNLPNPEGLPLVENIVS